MFARSLVRFYLSWLLVSGKSQPQSELWSLQAGLQDNQPKTHRTSICSLLNFHSSGDTLRSARCTVMVIHYSYMGRWMGFFSFTQVWEQCVGGGFCNPGAALGSAVLPCWCSWVSVNERGWGWVMGKGFGHAAFEALIFCSQTNAACVLVLMRKEVMAG